MDQVTGDERLRQVRRALFDQRYEEAGRLIESILDESPDRAEAWYLKARSAQLVGPPEVAESAYRRALVLNSSDPESRYFYAEFLLRQRRYQEGHDLLSESLPEQRFAADCRFLLGLLLTRLNRHDEALRFFAEAGRQQSFFVRAAVAGSQCHLAARNPTAAIAELRQALKKRPDDLALTEALAVALHAGEEFAQSDRLLAEAVARSGDSYQAQLRIGAALYRNNDMDRAIEHWMAAHDAKPDESAPLVNIASAYRSMQKYGLALSYSERALERDPTNYSACNNLGNIYFEQDAKQKSVDAFKRAIATNPDFSIAYANCSRSLFELRRFDEAVDFAHKAIYMRDFDGESVLFPLNVLMRAAVFDDLDYLQEHIWEMVDGMSMSRLTGALLSFLCLGESRDDHRRTFKLHCDWGDYISRQASHNPITRRARNVGARARSDSKIRLGILSGDLRSHVVAKFAQPLFEHYDRGSFEVHCFSPFPGAPDPVQQRIIDRSDSFTRVSGKRHAEVAQRIADDGIDIVIELNGFTRFSELVSLAYRPAPVQIGWLGYPFTMGIPEVDYLLLDREVAPGPGGHLREQALLMPESWVCFATTDGSDESLAGFERLPIANDTPAAAAGFVTFGTLNNPYKYSRRLLAAWARILQQVDRSEFLFVRSECASRHFRDSILKEFARHKIDAERIRFTTTQPDRHLPYYNEIDISLDTFPQTGGTTTCESLWMGCPVVSLVGQEMFERLSNGILKTCGAEELTCSSIEDYIAVSVSLAENIRRLRDYRKGLRDMILRSPICDTESFVVALQDVLKRALEESLRNGE